MEPQQDEKKLAKLLAKEAKLKKFLEKQDKQKTASTSKPIKPEIKKESDKTAYSPRLIEQKWYDYWMKNQYFSPNPDSNKRTFFLPMPPPNVTGVLHLGHALMASIQDTIVRWKRMSNFNVLYLPGSDHAGIATQSVVEKKIMREEGKTRHDLGRDEFTKKVWGYKNEYGCKIYNQLKRIGVSADWSRESFTLNDKLSRSVNIAFIKLFEDGLIKRESRLVNWCSKLNTTLSDLEVDNRDVNGGEWLNINENGFDKKYQFGILYEIIYRIDDSDLSTQMDGIDLGSTSVKGSMTSASVKENMPSTPIREVIVSTTRPETLFGDVALAVNPTDDRYIHLINKHVIHPLTNKRIPIIADEEVEKDFGTGVLKITPAHDPTDYRIGKKHSLSEISSLTPENRLTNKCGEFSGQTRYEARINIIKVLNEKGLLYSKKEHKTSLPICSRSGDIMEPRILPQWWVDCSKMAKDSIDAVENGDLNILPKEFKKTWNHWLNNIQDWCVSRQLWWGHRIPAYLININTDKEGEDTVDKKEKVLTSSAGHEEGGPASSFNDNSLDHGDWIVALNEEEALKKAYERYPNTKTSLITIKQDEDVLDTWFSSALWPFATLGWPDDTADLSTFYPASLLETGSDILFFWAARMVMFGLYFTKQVPFNTLFLHSIIRDSQGRKMSKSLGNVIDPIHVIEGISLSKLLENLENSNLDRKEIRIASDGQKKAFPNGISESGADALRIALVSYIGTNPGLINLDINRIFGYRRFCNKLWNVFKYSVGYLEKLNIPNFKYGLPIKENISLSEKWVLSCLSKSCKSTINSLESFDFLHAVEYIYNFWIYQLCDVFIEVTKTSNSQTSLNTLFYCLDNGLRLLHPFMPFITEELYSYISKYSSDRYDSICVSEYPSLIDLYEEDRDRYEVILEICYKIRKILVEYKNKKVGILIKSSDVKISLLKGVESDILALAKGTTKIEYGICDPESLIVIE
eukprot:GHVP01021406.1.p1 GENE.GHVP01021406.1~~GHVP01021406.1.p1  ORF type:complete len:974 (-),score=183.89 GHVP01021406.1:187-3108(-)